MGTPENNKNSIDSIYTSAYDALHDALVNTDAAYQNIENHVSNLISEGRILEEQRDTVISELKNKYNVLNEAYRNWPGEGSGVKAQDLVAAPISQNIDALRSDITSLDSAIDSMTESQKSALQSLSKYGALTKALGRSVRLEMLWLLLMLQ
jgi:predicted  nucleic acid-binding Zn-ribbon protein